MLRISGEGALHYVITIAMSAVIGAKRERVWRALTDPGEISAWDERIIAPVDPTDDYPTTGKKLRWRYRLGGVQLVMNERTLEVESLEKLRSKVSIGSLRFEQTYTLQPERDAEPRTRLAMKLVASNSVPLIGEVVDRLDVRKMSVEHIDLTLRSIQKWCENHP